MASASSTTKAPRWTPIFRPRFGLASLLALVTLAAVGSWYWWRLPFEQESKAPNRSLGIVREVETVRRLWGNKTIRQGPVIRFDDKDRKISESHYREGTLHGPSTTWFADGQIREQGEHRDGKKEGEWVRYSQQVESEPLRIMYAKGVAGWKLGTPDGKWEWFDATGTSRYACNFEMGRLVGPPPAAFDSGLGRRLAEGGFDDPLLVLKLLEPSELEAVEAHLKDVIGYLSEKHEVPIVLDAKRLEESGVNIDARVSLRIQEGPPFIECLARILAPLELVGDYRHGMLLITTPDGAAAGDRSGVSQIKIPPDSPLASIWNREVSVEFVETPLADALGFLEKQVGLKGLFVLDEVPEEPHNIPITVRLKGLPFRHVLGGMLADLGRARLKDDRWIIISLGQDDQAAIRP